MFKRVIRLLFLFAALIICVSGCGKTGDSYENNETELLAQCYMDIIKNNYDFSLTQSGD